MDAYVIAAIVAIMLGCGANVVFLELLVKCVELFDRLQI